MPAEYSKAQSRLDAAGKKNDRLAQELEEDRKTGNRYYKKAMDFISGGAVKSDDYEKIMEGYRELGEKSGYGAVASTAAQNGGNVDSYAQAQAARQLKSFENAGNAAALDYYRSRAEQLLGGAAAYDQSRSRTFEAGTGLVNNDRAIAADYLNAAAAESEIRENERQGYAERTGRVPLSDVFASNPYLNSDGSLKQEFKNVDFQALINSANEKGDEDWADTLRAARWAKVTGDSELMKRYGSTLEPFKTERPTAAVTEGRESRENELRMNENDNAAAVDAAKIRADADILASNNALRASLAGFDSDEALARIEAESKKYGYDKDYETKLLEYETAKQLAEMDYANDTTVEEAAWEAYRACIESGVAVPEDLKRYLGVSNGK